MGCLISFRVVKQLLGLFKSTSSLRREPPVVIFLGLTDMATGFLIQILTISAIQGRRRSILKLATIQPITSFTKTLTKQVLEDEGRHGLPEAAAVSIVSGDYKFFQDHPSFASSPIVDLRSPSEFEKGRVVGADNVPLLDNHARELVGRTYKELGKGAAVDLGIELFEPAARPFLGQIDVVSPGKTLLVYCARGGMRSQSVALWLSQLGYRIGLLEGGYKTYRRQVLDEISLMGASRPLVINGRTGAGKTCLIQELALDVPVIDLEALANHRGSAFGDFDLPQNMTQQLFENSLAHAYAKLGSPVRYVVELENFIGPVVVPQVLRVAMKHSPHMIVTRDFEHRVACLIEEYCEGWTQDKSQLFIDRLELLKKHMTQESFSLLVKAAKTQNFRFIVRTLLRERYDRLYDRSMIKLAPNIISWFNLTRDTIGAKEFARSYCME